LEGCDRCLQAVRFWEVGGSAIAIWGVKGCDSEALLQAVRYLGD